MWDMKTWEARDIRHPTFCVPSGVFIPLGTDRPLRRSTVVNYALISLNLLAFVACLMARGLGDEALEQLVRRFGLLLVPTEPWRFVTYAFLHADFWHLLGNMLFLWVFGALVEDRLGRLGYACLYLGGAVMSGVAHVAVSRSPVIGASGAVAAVTGCFLVLFPRTNIKTLILIVIMGIVNIPALWFIGFAIVKDVIGGMLVKDEVARGAHLGGYVTGVAVGIFLLATRIIGREPYDLVSLLRQARRRAELRSAVSESERERPGARVVPGAAAAENQHSEALAAARADVSSRIARRDMTGAGRAYLELLDLHGPSADTGPGPGTAVMGKRHQLELAAWYYETADYKMAMMAYERYLHAYPRDVEVAHVKLLMGLIAARYLGQPERARALITDAEHALRDDEQIGLARSLLSELGSGPAVAGG